MSFTRTRPRALGDIMTDLTGIVSLVGSAASAGGISGWFTQQITALNALPQDAATIQAQITAVRAIIVQAGSDTTALYALDAAQNDLAQISANYPQVKATVGEAMVTVTPLLSAGASSSITSLVANSPELVSAFDGLTSMIAFRDDARSQLASIANDQNLSAPVRAQVAQAVASAASSSTTSSLVKWGVIGLVGWIILKKVL